MNSDPAKFQEWIVRHSLPPIKFNVDSIHSTLTDLLIYQPALSANGQFLMVHGGVMIAGAYKDAIPHIGEASFYAEHRFDLRGSMENQFLLQLAIEDLCYEGAYGDISEGVPNALERAFGALPAATPE